MRAGGSTKDPLLEAIEAQDVNAVKKLLASKNISWPTAGKSGLTALHVAAQNGLTEIVDLLLSKGHPIDARDDQLFTPLLCAASQKHFEIVRILLNHGADPKLANQGGSTALHYCIRTDPPLKAEEKDVLRFCIKSGCDLQQKNQFGETPLHQACMRKHVEMAAFLLELGAAVDTTNKFGETALHKACGARSLALMQVLLARDADPFIMSAHGLPKDILADLEQNPSHDGNEIQKMRAALATYEKSYKIKQVNLNDGADDVSEAMADFTHFSDSDWVVTSSSASLFQGSSGSSDKLTFGSSRGSEESTADGAPPVLHLNSKGSLTLGGPGATLRVQADATAGSAPSSPFTSKKGSKTPQASPRTGKGASGGFVSHSLPVSGSTTPTVRRSLNNVEDLDDDDDDDDDDDGNGKQKQKGSSSSSGSLLKPLDDHGHHKAFGSLGSGTRRRAGSVIEKKPIMSSSPQVSRLLRQPSLTELAGIFTPDPSFRQETTGFGRLHDMQLMRPPKYYAAEFFKREHLVFLCSIGGVVTVQTEVVRNSHSVLVLDSKGYHKMAIPVLQLQGKDFALGCLQWISLNVFPDQEIYLVDDDAQLKKELLRIEAQAPESSNCFRVGVVYCGENQTTEAEMFQNPRNIPAFTDFCRLIGEEIELNGWGGYRGQLSVTQPGTSYYCQFRGTETMFHVSNLLSPEEQRRLIGNDTALIYFHDSETVPFPSSAPRSVMTQVYCVAKPVDGGTKIRLGFMSRKTVSEFTPEMPLNPSFDIVSANGRDVFRSFLMCKLLNGYRSAVTSPPLDKMLKRPRQVVLEKLVEAFPASKAKRKYTIKKKDKKEEK